MPQENTNVITLPQVQRTMLSIQATPDIDGIRTAQLHEQDHTVIPCIALVEGVLQAINAPAPELALAEEFGRFPDGWNGRPVVFGHPLINGEPVSAGSPEALEGNAFGQLFNTALDGKKLKTEIWINESLVESLSEDAQAVIENLKSGEGIVEVSTGLFLMREPADGEFDGEHFEAIWRNIVPDHLAVLPEGLVGACSVKDGAGAPRTNQMSGVMRAAQLNHEATPAVSQEEQQGIFKRLLEVAGGLLNFRDSSQHLSDSDLRAALNVALKDVEPDRFFFILAVHSGTVDKGTFVYELGFEGTLFQRTFNVTSSGVIKIGTDATAVRPVTTFVPVEVTTNSSTQENDMNVEELVNALITNEGSQFTEDDREWLSSLEEDQLSRMSPAAVTDSEAAAADADAEALASALAANADGDQSPVTTDAYIAGAPAEVQQVLRSALGMHRARKTALVAGLVANTRNKFTQEALEAKDVEELEMLAELANVDVSFEGQGTILTAQGDDDAAPEPVAVFPIDNAAAA